MAGRPNNAYGRATLNGVKIASLADLLSVGFSRREEDVEGNEASARALMQRFGNAKRLRDLSAADLKGAFGLEGFESFRSLALIELGRRAAMAGRGPVEFCDSPEEVYELVREYAGEKREFFLAILVDAKNAVMRIAEVHIGTLSQSLVGAREVFREAVRDGASGVIVAHNHPSGDPTPSPEDRAITERLKQVGELLDIPLLDHLVIGDGCAVSVMSGRKVG